VVIKTQAPRDNGRQRKRNSLLGYMVNLALTPRIAMLKRFVNFEAGGINA